MRSFVAKLGIAVVLTFTSSAAATTVPRFPYDTRVPFAVHVDARYVRGPATVEVMSFAVDASTRATVYLVTPLKGRRHPGILFMPGRYQSRQFFLSEAIEDARWGATSMSVDDLGDGYPSFTGDDVARIVRRVVTLRRALDLLGREPGVDPAHIGYVGHSDGAELGGILAGIETRVKCYVLMSGGGMWDRPPGGGDYNAVIAPYDADNFIGRASPASLFLQSGLNDTVVPPLEMRHFQQIASQPKLVRWYDAGHFLNQAAMIDRERWLARKLALS